MVDPESPIFQELGIPTPNYYFFEVHYCQDLPGKPVPLIRRTFDHLKELLNVNLEAHRKWHLKQKKPLNACLPYGFFYLGYSAATESGTNWLLCGELRIAWNELGKPLIHIVLTSPPGIR